MHGGKAPAVQSLQTYHHLCSTGPVSSLLEGMPVEVGRQWKRGDCHRKFGVSTLLVHQAICCHGTQLWREVGGCCKRPLRRLQVCVKLKAQLQQLLVLLHAQPSAVCRWLQLQSAQQKNPSILWPGIPEHHVAMLETSKLTPFLLWRPPLPNGGLTEELQKPSKNDGTDCPPLMIIV